MHVSFVSAPVASHITADVDVMQCQHHWSHWLHYIDFTVINRKELADTLTRAQHEQAWNMMSHIWKNCRKDLTVNRDQQPATAEWKPKAVTCGAQNEVLNVSLTSVCECLYVFSQKLFIWVPVELDMSIPTTSPSQAFWEGSRAAQWINMFVCVC